MSSFQPTPLKQTTTWLRAALDLLAPPRCAGCGRIGSSWCTVCRAETDVLHEPVCTVCGARLTGESCSHCENYSSAFDHARSYALYSGPFRRLVLQLKHQPDRALGAAAAALAAPHLERTGWPLDVAVPVPLGAERMQKRGYNQVTMFGEPLSKALGVEYRPDSLRRIRETRSQVGLTGVQRRANLHAAFAAKPDLVAGKTVLLLDDVFTTGSTVNACANALFEVGASGVCVFTLARAAPGAAFRLEDAPGHQLSIYSEGE